NSFALTAASPPELLLNKIMISCEVFASSNMRSFHSNNSWLLYLYKYRTSHQWVSPFFGLIQPYILLPCILLNVILGFVATGTIGIEPSPACGSSAIA